MKDERAQSLRAQDGTKLLISFGHSRAYCRSISVASPTNHSGTSNQQINRTFDYFRQQTPKDNISMDSMHYSLVVSLCGGDPCAADMPSDQKSGESSS